jgi:DNA-binding transcriptional ArsR family regulator
MNDEPNLTPLWRALADPTRRRILDLLRDRPYTTGELTAQFPTSRFAVMKHLGILHAADLVVIRRHGRERWNHLNAIPLQRMYDRWVKPYHAMWADKLTQLQAHIEGDAMPAAAVASTVEQVELEIAIAAPVGRVWNALIDETTFWWPKAFYTSPNAKGFHIEPRLGGKMFEDWGDGAGVIWYDVFAINPPHSIDLKGCMAVPYGPAHTLLHLELAASGAGTILKLSDSTIGLPKDCGTSKIDGWKQLFEDSLKSYVEQAS